MVAMRQVLTTAVENFFVSLWLVSQNPLRETRKLSGKTPPHTASSSGARQWS